MICHSPFRRGGWAIREGSHECSGSEEQDGERKGVGSAVDQLNSGKRHKGMSGSVPGAEGSPQLPSMNKGESGAN